jgi:hypothetical protein
VRKFAWLLLVGLAIPAYAASGPRLDRQVTVEQLEQILAKNHGKQDDYMERLLCGLELSERLNAERLARAAAELPGPGSRRALVGISDEAAFLNLPVREIVPIAPPDHAAQLALLTLAVDYVKRTTHLMPDFFATRQTFNFEAKPWKQDAPPEQAIAREALSFAGTSSLTVFYRDGREFKQDNAGKDVKDDPKQFKLETSGEFGPILSAVLGDAFHGKMGWSRWEQGPSGTMAVFRYSVTQNASHYNVYSPDSKLAKQQAWEVHAYHGEIAINPADGSILRITLLADFDPSNLNVKANVLVEYGSVVIGNKRYICPVKSVALSVVRMPKTNAFRPLFFRDRCPVGSGFLRMRINDVRFTSYHLFRAESRILTDDEAAKELSPSQNAAPQQSPQRAPRPRRTLNRPMF